MSEAALDPVPAGAPDPPGFTPVRPPRLWRARRFFRSLNPLPLMLGPVFHRDMRISARRKGAYAARFVVLAIPTVIVALVFAAMPTAYYGGNYGSAAARIQSLQDTASAVATTVAWCQLITLSLIAPLLTAGAIVEERTARALSVIAASPLSPGRIIGGLFTARMVNLALLAVLPVPLILAIRTFGGLETSFILWSSAIAICSAVAMAAVGLWASTRVSRPAAAVSFALLFLLVLWAGPPVYVLCEAALTGWRSPPSLTPFIASPPAALALLAVPGGGPGIGFTPEEGAAINCSITLAVAVAALLAARLQLARLIATDRVELVRQPSRRQRKKALRRGATPGAPSGREVADMSASSRTISGNPVMWRELRQPLFGSTWKRWLGISAVVVAVGAIHTTTLSAASYEAIAVVLVPALGALVLLLLSAAAVPAGSITTELEARTWATLLTTPLRTHQILLPKVAGAMRRLWPPFLFVALHLIVCIARGIAPASVLALTLVHFTVFAAFLSCTGVFFSLCSRKSAVASTLNLSLALSLWLLGPILFGLVVALMFRGGGGDDVFGYFFFSNPAMSYGAAMAGLCEGGSQYDMGPLTVSGPAFFVLWALSLISFLLAASGVLVYAGRHFHRLSTARI